MEYIVGKIIIFTFICLFICMIIKKCFYYREQRNRNQEVLLLLMQWLTMEIDGNGIAQKLVNMGINNVVIYGLGILGDQLLYALQASQVINVVYAVDDNPVNASSRVYTKSNIDNLDNIDAIIISDMFAKIDIDKQNYPNLKMISLFSLVYD